jgi:hypothetical protein
MKTVALITSRRTPWVQTIDRFANRQILIANKVKNIEYKNGMQNGDTESVAHFASHFYLSSNFSQRSGLKV